MTDKPNPWNALKYDNSQKLAKREIVIKDLADRDTWNFVNKYRLLEFCFANDKKKILFNHDQAILKITNQDDLEKLKTKINFEKDTGDKGEQPNTPLTTPFDHITNIEITNNDGKSTNITSKSLSSLSSSTPTTIENINDTILQYLPKPNILLKKSYDNKGFEKEDKIKLTLNCGPAEAPAGECSKDDKKNFNKVQLYIYDDKKVISVFTCKIVITIETLEEKPYNELKNDDTHIETFNKESLLTKLITPIVNKVELRDYLDTKDSILDILGNNLHKEYFTNIKRFFGYYKFGILGASKDSKNEFLITRRGENVGAPKADLYVGPKLVNKTLSDCVEKIKTTEASQNQIFKSNIGKEGGIGILQLIKFIVQRTSNESGTSSNNDSLLTYEGDSLDVKLNSFKITDEMIGKIYDNINIAKAFGGIGIVVKTRDMGEPKKEEIYKIETPKKEIIYQYDPENSNSTPDNIAIGEQVVSFKDREDFESSLKIISENTNYIEKVKELINIYISLMQDILYIFQSERTDIEVEIGNKIESIDQYLNTNIGSVVQEDIVAQFKEAFTKIDSQPKNGGFIKNMIGGDPSTILKFIKDKFNADEVKSINDVEVLADNFVEMVNNLKKDAEKVKTKILDLINSYKELKKNELSKEVSHNGSNDVEPVIINPEKLIRDASIKTSGEKADSNPPLPDGQHTEKAPLNLLDGTEKAKILSYLITNLNIPEANNQTLYDSNIQIPKRTEEFNNDSIKDIFKEDLTAEDILKTGFEEGASGPEENLLKLYDLFKDVDYTLKKHQFGDALIEAYDSLNEPIQSSTEAPPQTTSVDEQKKEILNKLKTYLKPYSGIINYDETDLDNCTTEQLEQLEQIKTGVEAAGDLPTQLNAYNKYNSKLELLTSEKNKIKDEVILGNLAEFMEKNFKEPAMGKIENCIFTPPNFDFHGEPDKTNFLDNLEPIKQGINNFLSVNEGTDKKKSFDRLDTFYDTMKNLGKTDDQIKELFTSNNTSKTEIENSKYFEYKNYEKIIKNINNSKITEITKIKEYTNTGETLDLGKMTKFIRELTESVLGACRVIVKYRDDKGVTKAIGDKIIKKHSKASKYGFMEKKDYIAFDENIKGDQIKMFGPFSEVYDETEDTQKIFQRSFIDDGLIESAYQGKTLVMFGFGFSGSGKTYQLISPDNKDNSGNPVHILALCLEHIQNEDSDCKISLSVSELYPIVNGDIKNASNITEKPYLTEETDLGYAPNKLQNISISEFLQQFNTYNEKITQIRTNKMRITPTPNNPESSRSHIFYKFTITYTNEDKAGNKEGNIVIVDMAGTENTIEIKKNFLNVKATDPSEQDYKGKMEILQNSDQWNNGNSTYVNFKPDPNQSNLYVRHRYKETNFIAKSGDERQRYAIVMQPRGNSPNSIKTPNNKSGQTSNNMSSSFKFIGSLFPLPNMAMVAPTGPNVGKEKISTLIKFSKNTTSGYETFPENSKEGNNKYHSYFNYSRESDSKKTHKTPTGFKTREELGLATISEATLEGEHNVLYVPHKALYNMFLELSKVLYNYNYDTPIANIFLVNFNFSEHIKLINKKTQYFYQKIKDTSIEQITGNENTYMGRTIDTINDDEFETIIETFYKEFLLCKDTDNSYNFLEWLDEDILTKIMTIINIKQIIKDGEYIYFDKEQKALRGSKKGINPFPSDIEGFIKKLDNHARSDTTTPKLAEYFSSGKGPIKNKNGEESIDYKNPLQIFLVLIIKNYFLKIWGHQLSSNTDYTSYEKLPGTAM
jgi:hypothetical protein